MGKIDYAYSIREGYRPVFNGIVGQVAQCGKKEYYRRPPGVRIIIDTGTDIIFQHERREECNNQWDRRLPGGKTFDTLDQWLDKYDSTFWNNGDFLKEVAGKEMIEEVGLIVEDNVYDDMEFYYRSLSSATVEHDLYYFICKSFKETKRDVQADEIIERDSMTYKELFDWISTGKGFSEDRTRAVLFQYLLEYKREFIF